MNDELATYYKAKEGPIRTWSSQPELQNKSKDEDMDLKHSRPLRSPLTEWRKANHCAFNLTQSVSR